MYRKSPQLTLSIDNEIFIDNFAGGGGASTGIEQAIKRPVDIAINHDKDAIAMHKINHPQTEHYNESVWNVDPVKVCKGRRVAGAWFSPDCTHFSKASGSNKKPKSKKIRGLAWVAVRWIHRLKPLGLHPRVIYIENVEEFKTWGPLDKNGCPVKDKAGEYFELFVKTIESYGYTVEHKELKAHEYGAPTIRKRFFLIARCDNKPIVWPEKTHGKGLKKLKTAADCIDWSNEGESIFSRKRPLAENTLKRIAKGIEKFVINNPRPFIVPIQHYGSKSATVHSIDEPLRTITAYPKGGAFSLVTSHLMKYRGTCKDGQTIEEPLPTITAGGLHIAEVRSFLIKYYRTGIAKDINEPLGTITTRDRFGVVSAFLTQYYGKSIGADLAEPFNTIMTKNHFGLVTVEGDLYQITDITLRMLTPRELFNGQGFPNNYVIDKDSRGKKKSIKDQVARCGNAVPPAFAKALVAANYPFSEVSSEAA